jgi:hypothetical protein
VIANSQGSTHSVNKLPHSHSRSCAIPLLRCFTRSRSPKWRGSCFMSRLTVVHWVLLFIGIVLDLLLALFSACVPDCGDSFLPSTECLWWNVPNRLLWFQVIVVVLHAAWALIYVHQSYNLQFDRLRLLSGFFLICSIFLGSIMLFTSPVLTTVLQIGFNMITWSVITGCMEVERCKYTRNSLIPSTATRIAALRN